MYWVRAGRRPSKIAVPAEASGTVTLGAADARGRPAASATATAHATHLAMITPPGSNAERRLPQPGRQ
ncbi:hypothetical protein XH84_33880 [Bradyrhizobium nanningense]|nr:hypothetical protein XH84_33880 [Bradyrhizobium nanningense]